MINYTEITRNIVNGNRETARRQILDTPSPAATALIVTSQLVMSYEYTYPRAVSTVLILVDQ